MKVHRDGFHGCGVSRAPDMTVGVRNEPQRCEVSILNSVGFASLPKPQLDAFPAWRDAEPISLD